MESLQIRTGQISLQILDDNGNERGIFKFNPQDIKLAERVSSLQFELDSKMEEFEAEAKTCDTADKKVALLNKTVDYFKGLIDECFGEGSSLILFGNDNTLSMFDDFFNGITPYFQKASKNRMAKYKKPTKK